MLGARREGCWVALLVGMTVLAPFGAGAQTPDEPPEEKVHEDAEGKEWITPDVAAEQEEQQEDSAEDVDEVIVEYGESEDTGDKVTDAEGKELEETPVPVVSKSVEVQDPDNLEPGMDKETGVQGQVVSRRPKKVLPDAPVLAKGDDGKLRSTLTDDRGRYRLYLPPGKYTLRSYYDLYHGARWDDVLVPRGAFKRINFVLDPITEEDAGVEEQEVIYLAKTDSEAAQLNIRKETVTVQDAISSEEIKRAGDSTAQGAAKRVVGVTIDDDGLIIIRGLPGRYNRILLNEIPIPGVDPAVPSVKLDIFPADIVSNLAVVKTPRPDLPGNFAGGLLLIETSSYPEDFTLKIGGSFGVNSLSTFRSMPTYQGGRLDWLGYDDGSRALPGSVGTDRIRLSRSGRYQSRDQTAQVGRDFPNLWNPHSRTALPKLGLKVTVGDTGKLKKEDRRAGYLLSFIYEYEDLIRTGFNDKFIFDAEGETVRPSAEYDFKAGLQEVLWGAFASGFVELDPDNFLNMTTLFSRSAVSTTLLQLGQETINDIDTTKNSYDFIGRTLIFNQLTGDHRNLGQSKARFRWNGVVAWGRRDQPDRREVIQQVVSQAIPSATRFYADLDQIATAGKTSVRFPVFQAFESTAYATIGFDGGYEQRDFTVRRFEMRPFSSGTINGDPELLFDDENLGLLTNIQENTLADDSYTASNRLLAGFVQLETPMTPWLKFLGLLQFQAFRQQVESTSPFQEETGTEEVPGTDRQDINPLPSANFSFEINPKMFVKVGYGMTVIRPALRELAPFLYIDFLRGWNIRGNPDLNSTQVQNVEARYEYYFGKTDLVAVTAFYKYFKDPIEFVVFSPVNNTAGYANAESAWLAGGELELRLGFDLLHEKLSKFFFLGNLALAWSETTLPADQKISGRSNRPLFNQSKYVTNLSLRFDDPDSGVMVGLVYNAFGPRLVEVGTSASDFNNPDVIDLQQHRLDLVLSWQPTDHVKVGLKWKNIAFAKRRFQQGNELVLLENIGTTVSIGAEYIY